MSSREIKYHYMDNRYSGKRGILLDQNLLNILRLKLYEENPELTAFELLDYLEKLLNRG